MFKSLGFKEQVMLPLKFMYEKQSALCLPYSMTIQYVKGVQS
jgi:hypothetical protein